MAEHESAEREAELARSATAAAPAPLAVPPAAAGVLRLQRSAGNAAVNALLARAVIEDIEVPAAVNHQRPGAALQDDHALRHMRHAGVAFVRGQGEDATGVDPSDISQGFIGDCFFLSPLMATARINPGHIARMVRRIGESPSGGDAYEVKLYDSSGDIVIHHVDDRFVTNADGSLRYAHYGDMSARGPELWVMLMEKAWASQRGGFNNTDFGQVADGLRAVTGKSSTWHSCSVESAAVIGTTIRQAVLDGKPVIPQTPNALTSPAVAWATANRKTIVNAHAYNVEGAAVDGSVVHVANPHGINHLRGLTAQEFRMIFAGYTVLDESMLGET